MCYTHYKSGGDDYWHLMVSAISRTKIIPLKLLSLILDHWMI
nr:MAG TPA: hypothetical protein [Herelleviridae sp.]